MLILISENVIQVALPKFTDFPKMLIYTSITIKILSNLPAQNCAWIPYLLAVQRHKHSS